MASLSTNLIANYIPSQNTLLNFLPKNLNLKSSGFIIIILGLLIGIFWLPILALFLNFIEIGKTLDKKVNVYTFIFLRFYMLGVGGMRL